MAEKKILFFILAAGLFLSAWLFIGICPAYAQTSEVVAEGDYNMGEGETMIVAKQRAEQVAMQNAVKQAGVYIRSLTIVRDQELSEDQITQVAAGVIQVLERKVTDQHMNNAGGLYFKVQIRALVNTDKVQQAIGTARDPQAAETFKKIQQENARLQQENTELKQRLLSASGDEKRQVAAALAKNEQSFTAVEWFHKGYDYQTVQNNADKAIEAYTEAIRLNASYVDAYNNRGNVYYDKKLYDLAIADFNQAITLNPSFAIGYSNRGNCYYGKELYDLAIADFNQAIALNPNFADAHRNRGDAYRGKKLYDLAIADYSQAIALNPNYAAAYNNRGVSYDKKSLYDLAIADYNQAIALNPNFADAPYNRGNAYRQKAMYDRAIADYNRALTINPNYIDAYYNRGSSFASLGQNADAIASFRQYIQHTTPDDPWLEKAKKRIQELGG